MFMEDGKKAHEELHAKCGTPDGCQCDFCKEGKCKESDIYDDYHNLQKKVCCPVGEGEDINYECAKGTCDKCGWYEKLDFDVPRGFSLNSIGIELDENMFVTRILNSSVEKPAKENGVKVKSRCVVSLSYLSLSLSLNAPRLGGGCGWSTGD